MNFDRHSQFDAIPGLSVKALLARIANDQANTAMGAQQATVDGLTNKVTLLKIQQFQPATADDYIAYGNAVKDLEAAKGVLPPLQAAEVATRAAWTAARKAFLDKANAIDDDPGAVEQV